MRYLIGSALLILFFACDNTIKGTVASPPEEIAKKKTEREKLIKAKGLDIKPIKTTGFASPECIHWNGQFFFVSNVGKELKPMEEDNDGYINTVSFKGKIEKEKFITGLNAPKGMFQVNDLLYVADIDKVRVFEAEVGQAIDLIDFSKENASFLNDITFAPGKLYVSATNLGQIFEIDLKTNKYKKLEVEGDLTSVNGLHFDYRAQQLYFVGFGKDGQPDGGIYRINMKAPKLKAIKVCDHKGMLDGVGKISKHELLVSDWNGEFPLIKINLQDGSFEKIEAPEKINGPADFSFTQRGSMLWIPAMMDGNIHGFPIATKFNK